MCGIVDAVDLPGPSTSERIDLGGAGRCGLALGVVGDMGHLSAVGSRKPPSPSGKVAFARSGMCRLSRNLTYS